MTAPPARKRQWPQKRNSGGKIKIANSTTTTSNADQVKDLRHFPLMIIKTTTATEKWKTFKVEAPEVDDLKSISRGRLQCRRRRHRGRARTHRHYGDPFWCLSAYFCCCASDRAAAAPVALGLFKRKSDKSLVGCATTIMSAILL